MINPAVYKSNSHREKERESGPTLAIKCVLHKLRFTVHFWIVLKNYMLLRLNEMCLRSYVYMSSAADINRQDERFLLGTRLRLPFLKHYKREGYFSPSEKDSGGKPRRIASSLPSIVRRSSILPTR